MDIAREATAGAYRSAPASAALRTGTHRARAENRDEPVDLPQYLEEQRMAEAKSPTRPPPSHSRRPRRDPREESTPPPPLDEVPETRMSRAPVVRRPTQKPPSSPVHHGVDAQEVLAQLTELEEEVLRLREQNGRDEAMIGQMLARVADREQEAKDAHAEARRLAERVALLEERIEANEIEDVPTARGEIPSELDARKAATAATHIVELEAAIARAHEATSAAEERAAQLEAKLSEVEGESDTAAEVAEELAEKIESLEVRLATAESNASAAEGRVSELASDLVMKDGKIDAAEMRAHDVAEKAAEDAANAKSALGEARTALEKAEARERARTEELAGAHRERDAAKVRVKEVESELAKRTRDIEVARAETRTTEATLKKRHEESLAQQKTFERQLGALETQLAEAKTGREDTEKHLKDLRTRATEMAAEQASLEERLAFALDDRDTVSRHMESMQEESNRAVREAAAARRELAMAREALARSTLAIAHIEAIEKDSASLREQAIHEARAALTAEPRAVVVAPVVTVGSGSTTGSVAMPAPTPAQKSSRPPRVVPVSSKPHLPSPAPPPPLTPLSPSAAPPAANAPAEDYETLSDSEVSFASVAPAAPQQLAAVAPVFRGTRPSNRPTPPRTAAAAPVPAPPAGSSLSDPRISVEEEEPQ
jgi:hypothetical protein